MSDQLSADLASLRIARDVDPDRRGPLSYLLIAGLCCCAGAAVYLLGVPYVEARVFRTAVSLTEITLVSPSQASAELSATGYVVPQTVSKVGAHVSGRVLQVAVKQGEQVKAGDVLLRLDDVDQRSAISAARSRVLAARARAQTARANLAEIEQQAKRARDLARRGVSPEASAIDLEARAHALDAGVSAADAEVKAAEAEVGTLSANLKHTIITAPIGGTVISKPAELGEIVGPQSTVVELADFSTLMVETDVPEGRLHQIKEGGPCEIVLDAYPERRLRGRTAEITPRVNRAKATVAVKVRFTDPMEGILPDMAARVSFLTGELDPRALKEGPRLVVPGTALADRDGTKVVFVVDRDQPDQVRMTRVVLGPPVGPSYTLVSGPAAGTRVVKDPPQKLFDGQRIKEIP